MALSTMPIRRSKTGLAMVGGGVVLFALGSAVPLCAVVRVATLPYTVSCESNLLLMVPGMALIAAGFVWAFARNAPA